MKPCRGDPNFDPISGMPFQGKKVCGIFETKGDALGYDGTAFQAKKGGRMYSAFRPRSPRRGFLSTQKMNEASYKHYYSAAKEAYDSDKYVTAIVNLEKIKDEPKFDGYAMFMLADSLRIIGRSSEAMILFDKIRNVPKAKRWLVALYKGQLFKDLGQHEKAISFFEKSAALNPGSTVPWVYLGGTYAGMERFEEACRVFDKALKAEGDLDEVHLNLGYNFRALEDYENAKKHFEKAVELDSDYDEAWEALKDIQSAIRRLNDLTH